MATAYAVDLYEGVNLAETVRVPRGSLKFTNSSGQLRIPNGPSSVTAYTFTTWVKITTDTNFYALWLSLQGASSTYWETGFDITGVGAEINDLSTERTIGQNFTVGKWYFFGVSHGTSGAVKVFIGDENGALLKYTTTLAPLVLPLSEKLLGGEYAYEELAGAMAETRFWNAVLSDAEFLAELYSDTMVRTSNAGGWWKLPNPTNKLVDSSAASNTLTAPTGTGTWAYEPGPDIGPSPTGKVYENIGMAEVIDVVYTSSGGSAYTGNVNETVTVSDAAAAVMATAGAAPETVTLSEATAAAYAAIVTAPETVALSEALGSQSNEADNLPETVALSESMTGGAAYPGAVNETVTLSEADAALYAAIVGAPETVALSEGVTAEQGSVALSETVTLSEALGSVRATAVSAAEMVTLSSPVMSELPSTDLHLVAEDWTPGSDWLSRIGGFTAQLHGSLSKQAEGGIEREGILGFSSSNYFSLAADTAHEFTPSVRFTYEFVIRGGAAGGNLLGRYASPFAGGYDLAAFSLSAGLGIYNDDGTDYYAVAVGGTPLDDDAYYLVTVLLDGAADQFKVYINGVEDASEVSSGSLTNGSPGTFFLGNSNGNDQPFDGSIVEVLRHRTALNDTQIRDRYRLNMVAAGIVSTIAPSETVTVSDAAAGLYSGKPSIAETVTVTEGTTLAQVLASGLAETVTLSDSATALAALARSVSETVSLAEALASSIVNSANIAETVTLTEAVALSQVLTSLLAETVTLAEAMIGYIPRILVMELGDSTGLVASALTAEAKIAVETGDPSAVIAVTLTEVGMP